MSETRLRPSIDECEALQKELPDNPDKYRLLEMHFKRCSLYCVGSNSAANLKGRGVTILLCDEIDTWKKATAKETGALQQAYERTKDRWNRKHILTSTPTIESGQIWTEFKLGDQRYYFVPCPHCGQFQTFIMEQIKWDQNAKTATGEWDLEKVLKSSYYECKKCSGKIIDSHKPEMLRKGEWRPTASNKEPGRRSYHLNSIYPEWVPFGEVAVMFIQSKNSPEELQRFVNSWLALPFYSYGDGKEFEDKLDKRKTEVQVEGVPTGHKVILSCDVQINHLYFVARGWNKNKESIRLDYGMIPGFEELLLIARKWNAIAGFIDSAFRPQVILEFCAKNTGWIPTLGSPILASPMRWTDIPIDGGLMKGKVVKTLRYRANDWKETLNDRINGKGPKWLLPQDVGDDYKKQMGGEHRVEKRGPRGSVMIEWVRHNANHYWDCEVIQTVGFEALRPLIFDVETVESAPPQLKSQGEMEAEELRRPKRDNDSIWSGTKNLQW